MMRLVLAALIVASTATPAVAHAPIKGIGAFYNGLLHPLLVPEHLLILLGLGLLLGQYATPLGRWGWGAFVVAFWSGLAVAPLLSLSIPETVLLSVALIAGCLVCLDRPLGAGPFVLLAAAGGVAVGLDSAPDGYAGRQAWLALAGTALGGILVLTCAGALAAQPRRDWHRIGVRVAGSWTAASAGIALAFAFSGYPLSGAG